MTAFGPAAVVGRALGAIADIERAYLFGSWAARYTGEEGPPPGDVDVLIVGTPDRGQVYRMASALSDTLHREVHPTIVSPGRWDASEEGFIREVKSSVGRWRCFRAEDATAVTYEWEVETTARWMNLLTPVARPLFAWNHDHVMRCGGEGLARLLGARLLFAS